MDENSSYTETTTYAVLNCPVTRILGFYDTEEQATTAAEEFGRCSFAHQLTDTEHAGLAAQDQEPGTRP